jgi:hypothetical protein
MTLTGNRPAAPGTTTAAVGRDLRCEALFASALQRSAVPAPETVAEAIRRTVRLLGDQGCAGRMAQEFGDHPEAAAERMRWVRQILGQLPALAAQS